MFKDLLDRAKRVAEEHLPDDVLEAGRKLGRSVAAHAPAPLAEVINYVAEESDQAKAEAEAAETRAKAKADAAEANKADDTKIDAKKSDDAKAEAKADDAKAEAKSDDAKAEPEGAAEAEPAKADGAKADEAKAGDAEADRPPSERSTVEMAAMTDEQARELLSKDTESTKIGPLREDPKAVLERVKAKAERGLKPEDRLVVIYATPEEHDDVEAIEKILEGVDAEVRHNDLRREPQTARQLAKLTGVMVPPYVFINGRHWGNRYDLESLSVSGDLPKVVANLLDDISEEARRIGDVQESFSDELSVPNILRRWKQGHILCVDDLDAWYESDRNGERFYYQGGPRPVEDMEAVAEEIVAAVEAEEYEATWQLEPSVHLP